MQSDPGRPAGRSAPVVAVDAGGALIRAMWLVRLRWGTCVAEVAMILAADRIIGPGLPLQPLMFLVGALAATNVALGWAVRRRHGLATTWSGSVIAFDNLQLTALLFLSGGTSNPFSVFYLVQITIAAVILEPGWTWFVAGLGVAGYGALFLLPSPVGAASGHAAHSYAVHLQAMWVAFTASAAITAYFVSRLTSQVADAQRELATVRDISARHERLAAVTTLAAGAAHQLGTPLATMAVAAGELDRAIGTLPADLARPLLDDVRLIREEVQRSREILDTLSNGTGHSAGEMPAPFSLTDLVDDVLAQIGRADRPRVRIVNPRADRIVWLPRRALARALSNLLSNALEASAPPEQVTVTLDLDGDLRVSVRDEGAGMSPDVLARAGEPFFTTKAAGHGIGLFLARTVAHDLGGRLTLESSSGGTTATLVVPARIGHAQPA